MIIKDMEVLSADYLTVGSQHFLNMSDKMLAFVWAKKFLHMTTLNAIEMLKDIIKVHGRPKLVVTDVGPLYRNEYIQQLWSLRIDHSYLEAYMPSSNGQAERSVGWVKKC